MILNNFHIIFLSSIKPHVELFLSYLDVHWKGLEIRHHILIKKWKPGFLPMVCYNSVN